MCQTLKLFELLMDAKRKSYAEGKAESSNQSVTAAPAVEKAIPLPMMCKLRGIPYSTVSKRLAPQIKDPKKKAAFQRLSQYGYRIKNGKRCHRRRFTNSQFDKLLAALGEKI